MVPRSVAIFEITHAFLSNRLDTMKSKCSLVYCVSSFPYNSVQSMSRYDYNHYFIKMINISPEDDLNFFLFLSYTSLFSDIIIIILTAVPCCVLKWYSIITAILFPHNNNNKTAFTQLHTHCTCISIRPKIKSQRAALRRMAPCQAAVIMYNSKSR